jgi:opacity protein-like surface antigen
MVKLTLGILALCCIGISGAAIAGEGSGVYIYGAAGQAQQASITKDNQDAYMLLLGYQLNSKWAVEGGYVDLGTTTYTGNLTGLSSKSNAISVTAVRTWNVQDTFGNNGFSFLAKFGFAQVKSSATGSATIPTIFSASNSYTKKGVTVGLGAKFDFDQNWALRVDADTFDTGQYAYGRVPVYSVGLSYKF